MGEHSVGNRHRPVGQLPGQRILSMAHSLCAVGQGGQTPPDRSKPTPEMTGMWGGSRWWMVEV